VIVLITLVGLALASYRPIATHYLLWRYRCDVNSFNRFLPGLCELGPDVVEPTLRAFERHGDKSDVAAFRVGVMHTLRCLRYQQAGEAIGDPYIGSVAYADVPLDTDQATVMVAAYAQEPDPALREEMMTYLGELDFRARFAIFGGLLQTDYPLPDPWFPPPGVDPYGTPGGPPPEVRQAWCRYLAPPYRALLTGLGPHAGEYDWFEMGRIVAEIAANDCEPDDAELLASYLCAHGESLPRSVADAPTGEAVGMVEPWWGVDMIAQGIRDDQVKAWRYLEPLLECALPEDEALLFYQQLKTSDSAPQAMIEEVERRLRKQIHQPGK